MSDDVRREAQADSPIKLQAVAELGQQLGYWSIVHVTKPEDSEAWIYATVRTPGGLLFSLSAGSWYAEPRIHASVAHIRTPEGLTVAVGDVVQGAVVPDAYVSAGKSAAQIVKDVLRRVFTYPECVRVATTMRQRLEQLQADKAGLAIHIATMKTLGFSFMDLSEGQDYSANAWHKDLTGVSVSAKGDVIFSGTVGIADLPAMLALLKKGE